VNGASEYMLIIISHRPTPLLPPNACEGHQNAIVQKSLPIEAWDQSDTEGLTLDVNVPTASPATGLPIFVFVCGGGFTSGSSEYPEYDLASITQLSVESGMPMISVGLK
jgi:carboxylesterase type B